MSVPAVCPPHRRAAVLLTSTVCLSATLTGCGTPPQPLPTSPPRSTSSFDPAASGAPSAGAPVPLPPAGQPLPPGFTAMPGAPGYPAPTYPAMPGVPVATVTPTPPPSPTTSPPPPPAPKCRNGPTAAQVLATLAGRPGVPPREELKIDKGPFCAGDWQYSSIGLVADPRAEPLLVITRGNPSALRLIEAGADVCSEAVEASAPTGIRVLACGA